MLEIILSSLRNYFANPGKYYNNCDSDETTFFGAVNVLSFLCVIAGIIYGINYISNHGSYGVVIIVCNVLALGLMFTYAVVSDIVQSENIESINDPYAIFVVVSTFLGSLLTGSFIVLVAFVIVVELMTLIVYHIPMAIIKYFVRPAKNKKEAYDKFMNYKA
jgi:hypothetical protein